jgi:hypothetical protein
MTIKQLLKRLDKAEPEIRRRYPTSLEPPTAPEALAKAIVTHSVEQRHLDAMWQDQGPAWTAWLISQARARRVDRLNPEHWDNQHQTWSFRDSPVLAAIEVLSMRPNESPDAQRWISIPTLWNSISRAMQFSIDDLYYIDEYGERSRLSFDLDMHRLSRVMRPPDALELRTQIWEPHTLITPPLHRL